MKTVFVTRPNGEIEEVINVGSHRYKNNGVLEILYKNGSVAYAPGEWSIVTVEVEDE